MEATTSAPEKERRPYWKKIGIEIRELENRRWLGQNENGDPQYKRFSSSWQVLIPAKVTRSHRIRKQFSDEKEAISYAEGQADLHRASGPRAFALTDFEREDAANALPLLRELGLTFLQAAEFAKKHMRPESGDITMGDLVTRILNEKEQKNLRPDSLRTLRWNLNQLSNHFGANLGVKNVTRDQVRTWIEGLVSAGYKGRTLRNYIRYAKQFFNYAHSHQFRADNPAALLESPVVEWKPPCILSIDETKRLLRVAMLPKHADLLPAVVLQLFVGGLRTEETNRLTWADIDLKGRKVEVSPAVGKNRRDGDWRTAKIPPNAVEFLMLHKPREGKVTPKWFQARLTALHKDAGFKDYAKTHRNSKRHSFGSYGCQIHGPAWVQDQMGHNTKPTFLKFYRNAKVSVATAKKYFGLTPSLVKVNEVGGEVISITRAA